MTATLPSHHAQCMPFTSCSARLLFHISAAHFYASHFIYHMPHAYVPLFIKAVPSFRLCLMHTPYACQGCALLPFCHRHAVASCFSSISWLCLMHAPNSCYLHSLAYVRTSIVDPIQSCTNPRVVFKGLSRRQRTTV